MTCWLIISFVFLEITTCCWFVSGFVHLWLFFFSDTATASIAESLKVSKIVRLLVFLADCEMSQKHTIVMDEEKKPSVLTAILSCSVDIINSINSRVYMPTLKADRAISLLVTCVKEVQNGKNLTISNYSFEYPSTLLTRNNIEDQMMQNQSLSCK